MPTSPMSEFIRHLRSTLLPEGADLTDGQLLDGFVSGVAHQTALKVRATRAKRKMWETQVTDMPELATAEQDSWSDEAPTEFPAQAGSLRLLWIFKRGPAFDKRGKEISLP